MNSIEAAALYLSEGATTDPIEAEKIANGQTLDMDALQKSHLTRMMGFPFEMKLRPNKIHFSSKVEPYTTTWCRVIGTDLSDEAQVDKIVDACLRLKLKYEKEVKRLAKAQK